MSGGWVLPIELLGHHVLLRRPYFNHRLAQCIRPYGNPLNIIPCYFKSFICIDTSLTLMQVVVNFANTT